jgi:uncharacterized repeat protein (TIGR01451 family)
MAVMLICAGAAHAKGTAAGTTISNKATANFTVGTQPATASSNTVTITVAQLANVTVSWLDGSNVAVASPSSSQVLTFKVTNTGNGPDTFTLGINDLVGGGNFNPTAATQTFWIDTNGDGKYDAGDTQVIAPIPLNADQSATVFVLNNIPAGQADGNTGISQLLATSSFGPGNVGQVKPGAGAGGVDAILAIQNGQAAANGTYQVNGVVLTINKSSAVKDPYNGTEPVPGAVITYTLQVSVSGSGTAKGVTITDPLPASTSYKSGTLTLNGTTLTDVKDADAGDVGGTTPNTVTVGLGDLTSASGTKTITFQVTIN